jgi:nesprin-1
MKAQFEVHNLSRGEAGAQLNQALHVLPVADEDLQRQFYAQLEDRWRNIASQIASIQATLRRSLSLQDGSVEDKLPILEKELKDIQNSMNDMHGIIKTEEDLLLYIERLQVKRK